MKFKTFSILLVIILLAIFLRFFRLDSIPNGLYQDETSIGYSAYSIIETGKDEYGKDFPVYFKSFGDQKLPVYIYSTVASVRMFGLTPFAVRTPSAFFGVLSVVAFFFFVKFFTKSENLALTSSFLLAINPWSLHYNRAAFEVSIGLFLFIVGGYLLGRFFKNRTKGAFLGGTICFVLALYSYNLTRLLSPLLFLFFVFVYRNKLKSVSKKEVIIAITVGGFMLIPFLTSLMAPGGVSSAAGTLINSSAVAQAPIAELRAYMLALPTGFDKLFFNKYVLTGWQYVQNIFSYFSVDFFFLKGSGHGNHGMGNMGYFYLVELPFILIGIISFIRNKIAGFGMLIGWGVITIMVASLTREAPHATRSYFLTVPLIIFSGAGVISVFEYLKKVKSQYLRNLLILIISISAFYNLTYYFLNYYIRFPVAFAEDWRAQDVELVNYLKKNEDKFEKIIIDPRSKFIYTSHLFYTKYDPIMFQETVKRSPDDPEGFSVVRSYGNFEYRDIDWEEDLNSPKTLIISSPDFAPYDLDADFIVFHPEYPVAFAKDQKVILNLVNDKAYVLFETK